MPQITDWLSKLGTSEHAQRFAENRIDLSVLPDPIDRHLKDRTARIAVRQVVKQQSRVDSVPDWSLR